MTGKNESLSIGRLAAEAGAKVQTVRYYEEIGLMPKPLRTTGNQRRYGPAHRARLGFIRHGRELGFSLDQIRSMLALSDEPDRPCDEIDEVARAHLADVEARIERLEALRTELRRMIRQCSGGRVADCRIIQVVADHDHRHCVTEAHATPAAARQEAAARRPPQVSLGLSVGRMEAGAHSPTTWTRKM